MNKKQLITFCIIGVVGGAIAALCLRLFTTTLPVLAIGGIIGAGAFAAFTISIAISAYWGKNTLNKGDILPVYSVCATSVAIGAGLAAALTPEIFAKWYTAISAGAVIGAIGLVGGALATKYVILPMIEKIGECFSSEKPDSSIEGTNATKRSPEPRSVGGHENI